MSTELMPLVRRPEPEPIDDGPTRVDLRGDDFDADLEPTTFCSPLLHASTCPNTLGAPPMTVAFAPSRSLAIRHAMRPLVSLRCELPEPFLADEAADRRRRRRQGGWLGSVLIVCAALMVATAFPRRHDGSQTMASVAPARQSEAKLPEVKLPEVTAIEKEPTPRRDQPAQHHHPRSTPQAPARALPRLPPAPPADDDPT
jgi:hypothetical protein